MPSPCNTGEGAPLEPQLGKAKMGAPEAASATSGCAAEAGAEAEVEAEEEDAETAGSRGGEQTPPPTEAKAGEAPTCVDVNAP